MNKKTIYIYIVLLITFSLFTFLFVDVNLIYLKPFYTGIYLSSKFLVTFLYTVFIVCFFTFYCVILKKLKEKRIGLSLLRKLILVSVTILIFSYPAILSYDIFNYVITAKVTYFYQENPYLVMPNEFNNEPFLIFTRATNKFALYGPSWIVLSFLPQSFGLNNLLLTIFFFKILVMFFYLGTSYLIYKISKNLYAVAFFALNPLVLIETLVSGHNDIVMIFLALLSFYLLLLKKSGLSILSIIFSILIKYATFFIFPVWVYAAWKVLYRKSIEWSNIWFLAGISVFVIFLLSPFREEMYPWYAVWFMPFVALTQKKLIQTITVVFTFGLLLRYIPFMALSTYQSPTPEIRILVTVVPLFVFGVVYFVLKLKKQKWEF